MQDSHNLSHITNLSYFHNPGSKPLNYLTIGNVFETAAEKYGQTEAIVSVYDNRRITYEELLHDADKLAAGLQCLGIGKGERIGLWAPNIIEWVTVFYAASRLGLITVTLNPTYEATELNYCLNKCGVKALVCSDVYKTLDFYGKLCTLLPELATSGDIVASNTVPTLTTIIVISQTKLRGTYNYYDVLGMVDDISIKKIRENQTNISPDDICNIQFSSGTTGFPKATCLTHFQIVNNAFECGKRFQMNSDEFKICLQVPLFHVFGLVSCVALSPQFGITMVLPSPTYNSTANLNALEQEKCSIAFGTPTMYLDLINVQRQLNKKIFVTKAVVSGALCPPSTIKSMKEIFQIKHVLIGYGATELTCCAFQALVDDNEYQKTETVGYIGDYIEAKVVDNNGKIVPFGTPGELCVRGYLTMAGYWDDPERTNEAFYNGKWYRTGDQFILQEDGYARIVGRVKDMIIRGGENIFPKEIEEVLSSHPDILEVSIIGMKSERLGEEVCACVRVKPGSNLTLDSLKVFCKGKIANYKIPSHLKVMDTFPKTTSGKTQKFLLKQQIDTN
ncbi:hypothetical protein RI129_004055 [Pyrocoelia pectoralis]|uniref:Medium-chain acyl-CoA ligase ACSF2, mitochondrial n=1 Tax=Pyrocoelia pectoralis TaxID=417401 RepID=A0AAN7ZVS1_9COLE